MSDETVRIILLTIMGCTAASTLSFPILFARYQWRKTPVGRALMIKSTSTAAAVTTAFLMNFFNAPPMTRYAIYACLFTAIAVASLKLTRTMLQINNSSSNDREKVHQ